jgi:uncharacterized membrane protein (DUF485 family)
VEKKKERIIVKEIIEEIAQRIGYSVRFFVLFVLLIVAISFFVWMAIDIRQGEIRSARIKAGIGFFSFAILFSVLWYFVRHPIEK